MNHQNVDNYELAFWQRVLQPLTTGVMVLLAIPFIFGSLRSVTMSVRLVLGAMIGFSFHLLNEFFAPLTQVYHWPPLLSATCPTLLFAGFAVLLLWRVR